MLIIWAIINLKSVKAIFQSLLESVKYVVDYIDSHGPFDGILTFSQSHYIPRIIYKAKELPFEIQINHLKYTFDNN